MDRGPVDRPALFPHGQLVRDGERLAVAHDHAVDGVVRHPGPDPRVHAHAGEADLVARPCPVAVGEGGQLLLVRAPPHLGGGRALLAEALDAPGVDELVHPLRLVGDLRVALAAMDDLDAQPAREVVELLLRDELADLLRGPPLGFPVRDEALTDVDQALLGEMRDQAGVGAMLDHRRGALVLPPGDQAPDGHVPPVKRSLGRVLVRRPGIGIPQLGGGVHIQHSVVVAPLEDLAGVDVPGEVDEEVARGQIFAEQPAHIFLRHAVAHKPHAPGGPRLQLRRPVLEIHDGDVPGRDLDQLENNRERALGHGPVAHEEDFSLEFGHDLGRLRCARGAGSIIRDSCWCHSQLLRHEPSLKRVRVQEFSGFKSALRSWPELFRSLTTLRPQSKRIH